MLSIGSKPCWPLRLSEHHVTKKGGPGAPLSGPRPLRLATPSAVAAADPLSSSVRRALMAPQKQEKASF